MSPSSLTIAIRERVSIVDALEALGLDPPRRRVMRCPVPSHEDKHPSCSVFSGRESEMWKCHSCGVSGDVITLVEKVLGTRRPDAARWLAERFRIECREEKKAFKRVTRADYHAVLEECSLPRFPVGLESVYENMTGWLLIQALKWEREAVPFYVRVREVRAWYQRTLLLVERHYANEESSRKLEQYLERENLDEKEC